ncbi:MAG: hypothetical protein KatS3mg115_1572 [Candidatus Poribacteria bacterium]|nr:MAG: hypothetical protein KatS3mg115_1572 [Candidatus Poribacteria bacterium]
MLIVANAVEGLTPENVVVSDNNGVVLSRRRDAAALAEEERRRLRELAERTREEKIMEILNRAYGNKVDGTTVTSVGSARVTAEFDHDQIQVERVTYDPETVVAREYIVSESTEGVPVPAVGVPGVTSNILGVGAVAGSGTQTREESITEYQAGTTHEVRQQAPKLVSLSTAVVVNSQVLNSPPGTPEYIAEQNQIKNLIYAAVGYDPANPDGVIKEPRVEFIRFAPLPEIPTAPTRAPVPWYRNPLAILAAILGLLALVLLALLLKPRLAREAAEEAAALSEEERRALEAALEQQRALEESAEARARRRRQALIDLADASPEDIERVLRYWEEESTETD